MSQQPPLEGELDRYLRSLSPSVQGKLLVGLERSQLGEAPEAAHRVVLDRLRTILHDDHLKAKRTGTPQRLFCEPFEPFLVDEAGSCKHRGFILRASLDSVWRWLKPQIPGAAEREERAAAALLAADWETAQSIVGTIRQEALPIMEAALNDINAGVRKTMRLTGLLDSARALADLPDIARVLRLEPSLAELSAGMSETVERLSPQQASSLIERSGLGGDDLIYALRLIYSRLQNPAELLQILVASAGTDDAAKLRHHCLAGCVDIVLADLDLVIERIADHITRPADFDVLMVAIRRFHGLSSGMAVTVDLDGAEHWRSALAERRRRASEIVGREVARAPGAIRRALKPRRRDGMAPAAPDPHDILDAEHAASLVVALRPYRSEVAVNEILAGVARQVESFIEAANPGILQDLRVAEGEDRETARATFAAALSINEIVFGQDYAALLRRSGRLADLGGAEAGLPMPAA